MRFVVDENLDNRVIRGLLRRNPDLDIIRVQDLEIAGADDPTVLSWAAKEGRIPLTHDHRTVPGYAYQRISEGREVAGVIVAGPSLPTGKIIDDILIIAECSSASEWVNQIQRLPL